MYRIGKFIFDYQRAELVTVTDVKKVEPQVNELLRLFINSNGELVSRELIIDTLWPNRVITDDAFRAVIKKLRKALGDNAKSPTYIRTLPTKGFVLIVEVEKVNPSSVKRILDAKILLPIVVALSMLVIAIWYSSLSQQANIKLESLTSLNGSEVSPSYNHNIETLVFSHRSNKDDYLRLFVKSLKDNSITRLTFDDANYANAHFSSNGNKIAFTRSTPYESSIVIADFSLEKGLEHQIRLPEKVIKQRYLQAWASNGDGLYLSDMKQPGTAQGIWYFDIETKSLKSVTSPSNKGGGDYFSRESHNGRWLAVLRNTGTKNTELLIQHLASGELTHIYKLPLIYNHLVWQKDDTRIKLSSFLGDYAQYNLNSQQFDKFTLSSEYVNNFFYSCGKRCVFARQHNGNYLELAKTPNPFLENNHSAQVSYKHLEFIGAEKLPLFANNSEKIYFATQRQQEKQIAVLIDNSIEVIHRFAKNSEISTLQLNSKESKLAGIVDGRLFLLDLSSESLEFLSTDFEQIDSIYWHEKDDYLYFSRIEYAQPVLYRYDVNSGSSVRIKERLYPQLKLTEDQIFIIDSELKAWLQTGNSPLKFSSQLPSPNSNRWLLQNGYLYFTSHEENLAYLTRINLKTTVVKKALLAKNRYQLSFDISTDQQALISIRSVLAQSDLVKVEY